MDVSKTGILVEDCPDLVNFVRKDLDDILINWGSQKIKCDAIYPSEDFCSKESLERSKSEINNSGDELRSSGMVNYHFNWRHFKLADKIGKYLKYKNIHGLKIGPRGCFKYTPEGGMSWHTNKEDPGVRVYFSFVQKEDGSFFRYQDPNTKEIVTSFDKGGWQARKFFIHSEPDKYLWHCVKSSNNRFSLGFGPKQDICNISLL
ncbi:MAG: hypothetical protein CMK37_08325 [Porticoccaceae bacterium]|nr:hypothetical protein [Porticoccaceae bacterium]